MKKLIRVDGQIVDLCYFDNITEQYVDILEIKSLNFSDINKSELITKKSIIEKIYEKEEQVFLKNKILGISAKLSKSSIRKMISTIFDSLDNNTLSYRIKKELISNIIQIFYNAIPICKHKELKNIKLFDKQIIYRFALPVKINKVNYLTMIVVKEYKNNNFDITQFSIYDFRSKKALDRIPYTPERCTHSQEHTYSINDLQRFVNSYLTKYQIKSG